MNLWFSSSKTLRVEGCEALEEEATSFFEESSMDDDEEDDSWRKGSRLRIALIELEEVEDMVNGKNKFEAK